MATVLTKDILWLEVKEYRVIAQFNLHSADRGFMSIDASFWDDSRRRGS